MQRRCVSFLDATSGAAYLRSQVRVELSSAYNRKVHPSMALEQSIHDTWETKLAANPQLFNGTKFRLSEFAATPTELHMKWGLTDYKTYLGLCSRCDVVSTLGTPTHPDVSMYLSNKIGVAAALVTADDKLCFLKRSATVGAYPNLLDVPGGHPEPTHIDIDWRSLPTVPDGATNDRCVDEFFDSITTEICEEVNVPLATLSPPRLLGVTMQGKAATPSFAFLVQCSLDAAAVAGCYDQGPVDQYEATKLIFQSTQNVVNSWRSVGLTPSAAGCIELLGRYLEYDHVA
ncbi:hypothetical protein, variant [Aphanomyces invadans]|uniref:Nudix hydrolase domain-containing protein n=1 Tax=Aphanomyces invadans TaxID=157072 RepID=A0A024TMB9_9STRA|nr:hypothetical protein, variant [Aphanomyces invadans]ETV95295.1 hypothetical protein, variant [Aphanomyces invadans]|eukprot:XP_008875996.1 hypothetical protein, variant [Aphanomyces invadans]